jgi:predicted short-subunit dehydrogenase-like oxidoreductase (DUF2520 family)
MSESTYDLAIIGPGRVGTALGALYARGCNRAIAIGGRDKAKAEEAAKKIGHGAKAFDLAEAVPTASHIILAIPDDALESFAKEMRGSFVRGAVIVHCAGALGSLELSQNFAPGAYETGSMHPLQTFPTVAAAIEKLPGSYCFYEGSDNACHFIKKFGETVGMKPIKIAAQQKILYHAAASMASNFLVTLLDTTLTLGEHAGIARETFWQALDPLIQATIANVGSLGTKGALTGPIARGDLGTVTRHLKSLDRECPEFSRLYRELGLQTARLAFEENLIHKEQLSALTALLESQ